MANDVTCSAGLGERDAWDMDGRRGLEPNGGLMPCGAANPAEPAQFGFACHLIADLFSVRVDRFVVPFLAVVIALQASPKNDARQSANARFA